MTNDKAFIISKVDKNNTIVTVCTIAYDHEYHFLETIFYKKQDFDPMDKYVKETRKELESLKNILHITPQFYKRFYHRDSSGP